MWAPNRAERDRDLPGLTLRGHLPSRLVDHTRTMTIRPCLACGTHTAAGNRCPACATVHQRAVDARRGTTTQRGYGANWARISAFIIARDRACADCGATGSPGNPLTADHIVPKHHGGTDHPTNLICRCRKHNSTKGRRAQ